MFVIASSSTQVYRERPIRLREVAEELGVRYIVFGSVQESGDKLRVTADLVDAVHGQELWKTDGTAAGTALVSDLFPGAQGSGVIGGMIILSELGVDTTPLLAGAGIVGLAIGFGAQTLVLAKQTGGHVTAVDTHQPYLDELTRRAERAGLAHRITPQNASMFTLDFDDEQFDLIWSEGAIYIGGFAASLSRWRGWVRDGGSVVVSDLIWRGAAPPRPAPRSPSIWRAAR